MCLVPAGKSAYTCLQCTGPSAYWECMDCHANINLVSSYASSSLRVFDSSVCLSYIH